MNEWFDAEQRVERAYELYESGRWEDALAELQEALRVNPYQGEWHFNMGLTLDAMGRYEEAIDCYHAALEHAGEEAEILSHLAVDCSRCHRVNDALRYFERAQRLDPEDETPHVHRIDLYRQLGDHEQAELMFYLTLQINDANPLAYAHIARSLIERQLVDKAIWCLNQVRRLDPHDSHVHARLGEAYHLKGRHDRARRSYLRHLRIDPGDIDALMALGRLLVEMHRYVEAGEKFRRVTELDPTHIEAHFELGRLALGAARLEAAHSEFELVLRFDPMRVGAHQKLALIALRRGQAEVLRRHVRAELALQRDAEAPGRVDDVKELASLLVDAQMHEEAAEVLRRLIAAGHERDPRLWHQLAVAQLLAGKLREGIRTCRQAVRVDKRYTLAMRNLAMAHLELGELTRSRYWVERALGHCPDEPHLRHLLTRLRMKMFKRRVTKLFRPTRVV